MFTLFIFIVIVLCIAVAYTKHKQKQIIGLSRNELLQKHRSACSSYRNWLIFSILIFLIGFLLSEFYDMYLQPIITQYFIDNKSEIWLLFLIAHSKR